jgi:hypothetical protein
MVDCAMRTHWAQHSVGAMAGGDAARHTLMTVR